MVCSDLLNFDKINLQQMLKVEIFFWKCHIFESKKSLFNLIID
jgi:hypothetical protein